MTGSFWITILLAAIVVEGAIGLLLFDSLLAHISRISIELRRLKP